MSATFATSGFAAGTVFGRCAGDIKHYCADVTSGDGRLAACLYAHTATLADDCHAATEGMGLLLEGFLDSVSAAVTSCGEDIAKHCGDVGIGGIFMCLNAKRVELSSNCGSAVERVSPKR